MRAALVYGMAEAGEAVARQLLGRDVAVTAVDDRPTDAVRAAGGALGIEVVDAPTEDALARLIAAVDVVVPAPGVPPSHLVFAVARRAGVPLWSEFELVSRWGHPPLVAITGTNGKTTVTALVTDMLTRSGLRVVAGGNEQVPLVDVLDDGLDAVVVEASSFRLELTETFRPAVSVWLNVAEDHLDWHGSVEAYAAAKTKVWAFQEPGDVAIANADDPVVMAATSATRAEVRTFSLSSSDAYAHLDGSWLVVGGDRLVDSTTLPHHRPHDLYNGLAAAAAARAMDAAAEAVVAGLRGFEGLPHRVRRIGDADGVEFVDDSKATTPAAVIAAVRGFDHVVLIAGGRNKGLDLSSLRQVADHLRAVVAIGEAAPVIAGVFAGAVDVDIADSMDEAVRLARARARPGDAVLLSPGCASYDWYGSYKERGADFARAVAEQVDLG